MPKYQIWVDKGEFKCGISTLTSDLVIILYDPYNVKGYFDLTTLNVWVSRNHLRDTDIRKWVLESIHKKTLSSVTKLTAAEKLAEILFK